VSSSVREYTRFTVEGLFGYINHDIVLNRNSRVTILTGPNGCGKTHVLKLYRALLTLDISTLMSSPYSRAIATLSDGAKLQAERVEEGELTRLFLRSSTLIGELEETSFSSSDMQTETTEEDFPSYLHQMPDGRWLDARAGRYLPKSLVEARYGGRMSIENLRMRIISNHPWLGELVPAATPILIDTKRLDTSYYPSAPKSGEITAGPAGTRGTVGRIGEYIEQVRYQIAEARRESLQRSQQADEKFAATLLRRSRSTVNEDRLKKRYQGLVEMHAELNESGLTGQAVAVEFPPSTNPTERRILNVFIDDWEKKLAPLIPVNGKLKLLRRIINDKFMRKSLAFDAQGHMQFMSNDEVPLTVDQLSSGEQHLLALFTMLLFSAKPGSIVLIDEPEISLHAAWKHAFVHDLEQVADLSELSVILATHSSAVVNGRWDLVRELELSSK
jgi:ABC-type lipoprotein export system ATPase subunit